MRNSWSFIEAPVAKLFHLCLLFPNSVWSIQRMLFAKKGPISRLGKRSSAWPCCFPRLLLGWGCIMGSLLPLGNGTTTQSAFSDGDPTDWLVCARAAHNILCCRLHWILRETLSQLAQQHCIAYTFLIHFNQFGYAFTRQTRKLLWRKISTSDILLFFFPK